MSFSHQDALTDENVPHGQLPYNLIIGNQVKRVKTAIILSDSTDYPNINNVAVGERTVGLVSLANQAIAQNPNPQQAQLIAAVTTAINAACQPGGAISNTISNAINAACQPGGAISNTISNTINAACQPGGAISNTINNALP